ncbi:phytanoyl-CoA dioxygenase family protein [Phaeocystidibacter luteus]|uniref:Phytanoyl-CoA dioxygenase family protein n=1 Tax=Phaeocystidibacter luteus TaxID=911197 RepID=A0A6N6RFP4_9FLAO|nr:phytanoyl-CoA dioxygenase family protein [Phaeocystidibacter luteus]KAB2809985.1 phytanoyl-CoA dioxygenase family protein [Phaeocystidibacter luteus]
MNRPLSIPSFEKEVQLEPLHDLGYQIIPSLYSESEVERIAESIDEFATDVHNQSRSSELFSVRSLLVQFPELQSLLFNQNLTRILESHFEGNYFLSKSIYFDKPSASNWFVAYHQDLSISVDRKTDVRGYSNWTQKHGLYGVQPPLQIVGKTLTVRIHLDDTNAENGALRVIQRSHKQGIVRVAQKQWNPADEVICAVRRGGAMLMKPLTLHASSRTTNGRRRRVIHLEFCDEELEQPLRWMERIDL